MIAGTAKYDDKYIREMLKLFKLVDIRENYQSIIEEAIKEKLGYKDFLIRLIQVEEEGKKKRLTERLTLKAGFDFIKTLDDIEYDFNESISYQKVKELGTLSFMDRNENIIIIGPPGVGKSMIATGIGINACNAGKTVMFINAKELMDKLSEAVKKDTLKQTLKALSKVQLLIIDELSYVKMGKEKESIFFQVIRQRYEKSSLIITTNLPLSRWDEIFTGQLAATAILDRLVHHCHILSVTGDSFRVKGGKYLAEQKETKSRKQSTKEGK
ncbi:IS21-like element helper ATPase IstB [Proteiniborus sp. MB09-C3]|uniref:IS21-like element helper ATPase IstB n=1 Tax=Proteiniborus sp. MB09-C3 TaxID=3050072 RepID=UPI002557335A|nr:IS21-like element helper ATPase IstB [Proteiniborus sp. MB09-C3]WIV11338.1 IS21-like element helper ATPase IstB [Proteiniborus sp. MB09-C3]WIV11660.1 IS21-like element helper ATPase IstB [Proteiniborus sp. MB09-C3]